MLRHKINIGFPPTKTGRFTFLLFLVVFAAYPVAEACGDCVSVPTITHTGNSEDADNIDSISESTLQEKEKLFHCLETAKKKRKKNMLVWNDLRCKNHQRIPSSTFETPSDSHLKPSQNHLRVSSNLPHCWLTSIFPMQIGTGMGTAANAPMSPAILSFPAEKGGVRTKVILACLFRRAPIES